MDIFRRNWKADGAKATILLIHGTGEHSGRYEHVANHLTREGYEVISGDLPGWGKSPGVPGHIHSFSDYIDVVNTWVEEVLERVPDDHALFILGHSMGGLIAVRFIQQLGRQERLSGLLLSSPCLQLKLTVPRWKSHLAGWLDKLWPSLRMNNNILPEQVSRDPIIREQYRTDPLNYNKVSVRWFCQLQQAMQEAMQDAEAVELPLLAIQAGDDQLVEPRATELFVQRVSSADKKLICWQNLYHEVFNEPEREQVLQKVVEWLDDRIRG